MNRANPSAWAAKKELPVFKYRRNWFIPSKARFPIADRTGASVVVEYGQGKVRSVRKTGAYQIATNFVITNLKGENYRKSLGLNPKNDNAREMLKKLGMADLPHPSHLNS